VDHISCLSVVEQPRISNLGCCEAKGAQDRRRGGKAGAADKLYQLTASLPPMTKGTSYAREEDEEALASHGGGFGPPEGVGADDGPLGRRRQRTNE